MDRHQITDNNNNQEADKTSQNSTHAVGDVLRQMREQKGLALREISAALCIGERYLDALEQEKRDILPEPVYTLGFLRSYARYLCIDPEPLIAKFQDDLELQNLRQGLSFKEVVPESQVPSRSVIWISAGFSCALVIGWLSSQPLSTPDFFQSPSMSIVAPTQSVDESSSIDKLTQEETSTDYVSRQENPLPETFSNTPNSEPTFAHAQTNETTIKTPERSSAPPAEAESELEKISFVEQPASLDSAVRVPLSELRLSPGQTLTVKAEKRSWIEIRTRENRILLSRILEEGDERTFNARPGLIISTGNAGGLVLSTQTQKTLPLGKEGEILRNVLLKFERDKGA